MTEVSGPSPSRFVPHRPTLSQRLVARMMWVLVHGLGVTQRFVFEGPSDTRALIDDRPVIFAAWHNRLLLSTLVYDRLVRRAHPSRRLAAMVSASRDGALLAAILESFEVEPVRGSSSRRGPLALLEMTSWAERGCDLAITPDGPRGPCYVAQSGAVAVARITGFPVVPIAPCYRRRWTLRSWDRFQVPKPFGTCLVRLGEAIVVSRDEAIPIESWRQRLQEALVRVSGE